MTDTLDAWPAGATWVFQGTVAEDATGGTHVCSLTVTPGAGNELQVLYGQIQMGNTATAQNPAVAIDDGVNLLHTLVNPEAVTFTTANVILPFPAVTSQTTAAIVADIDYGGPVSGYIISGTMRFKVQVTTTAISVTQAFSVVCRIKGAIPTATLADTVGTPVLTTNTNQVF